jgi:class 3 adenylate cyclase
MANLIDNNIVEANIAIVLTDIIGSTKFVQKNGSYSAAKWFGAHDKAVMNFIARHNGQLIDASDGHLMMFPSVSDAIAFAFEYKKFLRKKKFPFRSRVGIHWDKMLIVKSEAHMVRAGGKRINLEGIGKNIAARTMSICGEEQILMSQQAYMQYKKFGHRNNYIPKKALSALVGLYRFKGVSEPEAIYAIGLIEAQLQPPPDGEKAKRIGGARKIKTRLRNKSLKELAWWITLKVFWISLIYIFIFLIKTANNFHSNSIFYSLTGIDLNYYIGWIIPLFNQVIELLSQIIEFLKT